MSAWLGGVAVLVLRRCAPRPRGSRPASARGCWPPSSPASRRWPAWRSPCCWPPGSCRAWSRCARCRTWSRPRSAAPCSSRSCSSPGIVALGAINRRRLLPALDRAARDGEPPGRAGLLLRRTLRVELVLGVAALAATGALAGYAPSVAEGSGPFSATADIGPARLEMTVDPARVGPNEMHVYLFDRRDRQPVRRDEGADGHRRAAREAASSRSSSRPRRPVPGHYVVSGAALRREGRLDGRDRLTRERLRRVSDEASRCQSADRRQSVLAFMS